MGIVNVTPDSFSDGGLFVTREQALAQARRLVADGADIVDIGAESTRPGHRPVSPQEEWARLAPLLATLVREAGAPVSIDTYKALTARRALSVGVAVVNDVWGLQRDPDMAPAIAAAGAGAVLMHNRETADPDIDIVSDMLQFFERSLDIAKRAGVSLGHVALDPGIGFGKSRQQNYEALRAVPRLLQLGFPLLIGVSRKSIFKGLPDGLIEGRLIGTLAANLLAAADGAQIFRVHDAAEHRAAFEVFKAVRGVQAKGSAMRVGFGLGSNIGDKPANIRKALEILAERGVARLTAVSRIYRTPPWGDLDQGDFANACAIGETALTPYELLAAVKQIEADMGREPSRRWGPRLIDVDILFLGDHTLDDPELTLPHKELFGRGFVLKPLAEIAPDLVLDGLPVGKALQAVDSAGVEPWTET